MILLEKKADRNSTIYHVKCSPRTLPHSKWGYKIPYDRRTNGVSLLESSILTHTST